MSNKLLFQRQQQQQQANVNSQLEINQAGVGGEERGEEEGLVETLQEIEHEIESSRCNDVISRP